MGRRRAADMAGAADDKKRGRRSERGRFGLKIRGFRLFPLRRSLRRPVRCFLRVSFRFSSRMALITRCPSCATLFKVVPDQLRISGGWVRCGQCKQVFDANKNLQADGAIAVNGLTGEAVLSPLRTDTP